MAKRRSFDNLSTASRIIITICVIVSFVFGCIIALDTRYASSAEQRTMQTSLDDILLSQLRTERRDIERTPPLQRRQNERVRLEEVSRQIEILEAQARARRR